MSNYASFIDVVNANIETCNASDPGAVNIAGDYVRVKPTSSPISPTQSQYGVYWLNQNWALAYQINQAFTIAQVAANLNTTTAIAAKAMLFMSYMTNIDNGAQLFELDLANNQVICRSDPSDKRIPS